MEARRRLLLALLGLGVVAFYVVAEALAGAPGFPLDDSWIHLQFARNLATGAGLSYQGGELVGGSTAPLWTALLSLVFLLPGGPVLLVKALGAACFLGAVDAVYRLARELDLTPSLATLAAALFVLTDWMVWAALSGMEISLFILLSLWGMILHLREARTAQRPALPRALVVLGVASLVRPEGLLLLALVIAERLLLATDRRQALRTAAAGALLASLVLLPVALLYWRFDGSPLPTTLAVKTEGPRLALPSTRHLHVVLGILFRPQPITTLLAVAGVVALAERLGTSRSRGLVPALWVLGLPLAYSCLSGPDQPLVAGNFGRYFFPLLPPTIVLGVVGLEGLAGRLAATRGGRWAAWPLLVLLLLPSVNTALAGAGRYALNVRNVEESDVAMARWIARHLPADARLGVQDIGAMAYFAPNPLLDLTGIVNPEIVPYVKGELVGTHPSRLEGLIGYARAAETDFLVLYPRSYGGLGALQSVAPGLRPVHRLALRENVTMAADELLVLATPWSSSAASP